MKAWTWLLGGVLLGIAAGGVWRGSFAAAKVGAEQSAAAVADKPGSAGNFMPGAGGDHPQEAGSIAVEEDALVRLMALGRISAVGMEEMLADTSDGLERILVIRDWAGLDEAKWHRLIEVLRAAAQERAAWEQRMVRVEAVSGAPGTWVLHYPADEGQLHTKLMRELNSSFTEEEATAIELAGDLKNFSYSRFLDLPLVDRAVRVKAVRTDGKTPGTAGGFVHFEMTPLPTNNRMDVDLPTHSLGNIVHPAGRLIRLLGSEEEVVRAATEAAGKVPSDQ